MLLQSAPRASAACTSRSSTTAGTRCRSSSPACTRNPRSRWRTAISRSTGKPLMALCHGTVGLQHAAMAIYNAWCDRVPVIVIGGNDLDAATRPPGVPTVPLRRRTSTRWCATSPSGTTRRCSLQHFAQSMVRAYKIAMTPPYGPVMIVARRGPAAGAGQATAATSSTSRKLRADRAAAGDSGAVKEAAKLLAEAQNPVIVADRMARTPNGIKLLVAARRGAAGAASSTRAAARTSRRTHYLSATPSAVAGADVILGLELADFWDVVNSWTDNGEHGVGRNPRASSRARS